MLSLPRHSASSSPSNRPTCARASTAWRQLVRDRIDQDPLSGHLFVFRNRRRDRIKILYWDRDGFAIWYKRLEKGTFRFPEAKDGHVEVTPAEIAAVLEGIDLSRARRLPRFALPTPQPA